MKIIENPNYMKKYEHWLTFDEATKNELLAITDNKEIKDRFYKDLTFGTGGLRGIMGAGTNRMNSYTVRKSTFGLANYLTSTFGKKCSVVIAYDSRINSDLFALDAALVLCSCGIKTYLFDTLMPTPVLSFSVKYLSCTAGIVITASHNPKEYNGYKVYDQHGCQLVPKYANQVIEYVNKVEDFESIPFMDVEQAKQDNLLIMVGQDILNNYLEAVCTQSLYRDSNVNIVFTPLHGSGNIPVKAILKDFDVSIVKEQELPDGNFSTVRSPNPEERDTLSIALQQAERENADIVIGTDPDCDRVGVGVKHNGKYDLLSGNQIGALLVNFVLSHKKINEKSTLVKTIVTNELGANIARKHGLHIIDTLTGFKYIGEQITEFEKTKDREFVIGYEESYGYLVGTHAKDKDAVVASMLICEMAAYYKAEGITLIDVLESLYIEYGYYLDALDSFTFKGVDGAVRIIDIMKELRNKDNKVLPNIKTILDYNNGIDELPKENVLKYILNDGSWIAVRPSGTEPKIKVYYSIQQGSEIFAKSKLLKIKKKIKRFMD